MPQKPLRSRIPESCLPVCDLESYISQWLQDGEIGQHSPATRLNRRNITSKLLWYLNRQHAENVGTGELRGFLAYLVNGHKEPGGRWGKPDETNPVSARTVRDYYDCLRTLFRWIGEEGGLDASPMEAIKRPVVRRDQMQPFTAEQVKALLKSASEGVGMEPLRNEALLLLMHDTGLRAAEVCGLLWSDVDCVNKHLSVVGKGNKRRTVPFGRAACKSLRIWQRAQKAYKADIPCVFQGIHGRTVGEKLTPTGLLQLFTRLGAKANLTGIRCSPHTMRHTFAVTFLRNGGDPFTLQMLMGHEDLAMTRRYSALATADVARQHRQFSPSDRLFSK